jgi:ribosomal RNA methyltransferase Nop2
MIFNLFSPSEAFEFIEANENARPLTIRTNTLKTKRKDLAKALI